MAWSAVEHDEQMVLGVGFGKLVKEALQASCVHPGQVKAEALSCCRLECCIQVGPLVGAPDDVGRTKPLWAVAPSVPVDEAKASLVEGHDLQRFAGLSAATLPYGLPYPLGEVFLKASCSFSTAFSWRGLPVLSLTFRRLRSCPTPSGWEYSIPRFFKNSSACLMVAISPLFMASWSSSKASGVTSS